MTRKQKTVYLDERLSNVLNVCATVTGRQRSNIVAENLEKMFEELLATDETFARRLGSRIREEYTKYIQEGGHSQYE